MPNICEYEMKIKGKNRKNVEEFIEILKADYTNPHHFYRVYDADVSQPIAENEDEFAAIVIGTCAWSVECCMFFNDYRLKDGKTCSDIQSETRRLNLTVEIFSKGTGRGFMEHYIVDEGNIITDETVDYFTYWYDDSEWDSIEDFNKENGTYFTKGDFDENGDAHIGGMEWRYII